jgi:hypothetical protein
MAAQPHLLWRDSGLRRGQRPAPDPDRPAVIGPRLRAADRPVDADRRGQLAGRRARVALGVPDQIFATITKYLFLAAVAAVGTTATAGAAVLPAPAPLIAARIS